MKIERADSSVQSEPSMSILTDAELQMLVEQKTPGAAAEMARRSKIAMDNAKAQPLNSDSESSEVEVIAPRRSSRSRRQVQRFNRDFSYALLKIQK